jgi:hypothetical protein
VELLVSSSVKKSRNRRISFDTLDFNLHWYITEELKLKD